MSKTITITLDVENLNKAMTNEHLQLLRHMVQDALEEKNIVFKKETLTN